MFLGALIDLGVPRKVIEESVNAVGLGDWKLRISRERRSVISGRRVRVIAKGNQPSRNWADIKRMIGESDLSARVRRRARNIFEALARAESKVHGEPAGKAHFHEVGATDSIVDIIGAAGGLEWLGIKEAACSPVPLGSGSVTCAHGVIPLPAPATVVLLEGIETYGVDISGETCTPTGAAILRATVSHSGIMPPMKIRRVGYGIGSSDWPDRPNVLRLILGERDADLYADRAVVIEANVDDMSPQDFEPMMEAAFEAGALDITLQNIQMKKNRPGVLIRALAPPGCAGEIMDILLRHSSTLGLRWHPVQRRVLSRVEEVVKTPYGKIRAKRSKLTGGETRITPEYDDLRKAARKAGVSMGEIRRAFWANVEIEK